MPGKKTFFFVTGVLCLSLYFAFNFDYVSAKENDKSHTYEALHTFTDVLALVRKNYVEEVDITKLINGAISGMLQSLDPHSSYLLPEMFKELQVETKGKFGGLGIEITVRDGLLTVVAPIEDSPAARAGVEAGDQIIKIGNEYTKNLSLIEAVRKMRGPRGTPITISVHRKHAKGLIPITVIRDVIKVKSVRSRLLEDGFTYVRITQFQDGSSRELGRALKKMAGKLKNHKIKGLVLDLRNNPGGLLTEAIKVSDYFLKDGIIVYTDGRLESQKQKYYAHDDGIEPAYPLVVMVNGGSASASEIVAGALQDAGRGLVLGEQTFGKGSVQTILPMENKAALRLTTALYFTRNGRSIQAEGIAPDITVAAKRSLEISAAENEQESVLLPREKDLPGAIKNPKHSDKKKQNHISNSTGKKVKKERLGIGSRKAMTADLAELLQADPQLEEALRLLKTWHIFKKPKKGAVMA